MKDSFVHGSVSPRASAIAITAVAASSTTLYPAAPSSRRIDVFPAPGAPVRMYRRIVVRSLWITISSYVFPRYGVGRRNC